MRNVWAKISYWWFIFMLFIIGLFTGDLFVNAETGVYNTSTYNYYYTECNNNGTNCILGSPAASWPSMGTISHPGTQYRIGAIGFRVYLSSSQTAYNANYTYQFKWRVCESSKWTNGDTLGALQTFSKILKVDYNTTNSATNATEGDTSVVGVTISDDASSSYCWYATFTYSPPVNVKYIGFYMSTNGFTSFDETTGQYLPGYAGISTGSDFRTNGLTITYTTDATSQAIQQQTTIINNSINNNTDAINGVNDTISEDDIDDPSDFIDEMVDMLPSNGVITSLITLPITLYQKILNSINGTCSQFSLGQLYGTNLIIPCIDVADYLGNTLWSTIDVIISGIFVLTIARKMVKAFEGFTSLKEGDVIND